MDKGQGRSAKADEPLPGARYGYDASEAGSRELLEGLVEGLVEERTKTLKESERRYRRLFQAVSGYFYTVKLSDGHAVSTRHRTGCELVTGYSPSDYAQDPDLWFRMVHPEDRAKVLESSRSALAGARDIVLVHRIRHKDGSIRWIRNRIVPNHDSEGRLESYDGVVDDVTAATSADEALHGSEHNLRLLLEHDRDIVFSLDRNHRLLSFNGAFARLLGIVVEGLPPRPGEVPPSAGLTRSLVSLWKGYVSRGLEGERFDAATTLELPEGGTRYFKSEINPLMSDEGKVEGLAVFSRDITDEAVAAKLRRSVLAGLVGATGIEALNGIAEGLERLLGAEAVIVAEFEKEGFRGHAARKGGVALPPASFPLPAKSCRGIASKKLCYYPKHGPEIFPEGADRPALSLDSHIGVPIRDAAGKTLGMLCALARTPIRAEDERVEIMELMAAKAAAEFARIRIEAGLRAELAAAKEGGRGKPRSAAARGEALPKTAPQSS
jgi:PAS domain S-box-containing protein